MTRKKSPTPPKLPEPPAHLSPGSQRLWRDVTELMAEHRSFTKPTRWIAPSPGRLALLTTGLEARDRATQAREQIAKDGLTTTTEATGAVHCHPLLRVEKDSWGVFQKCWTSLKLEFHSRLDGGNSF